MILSGPEIARQVALGEITIEPFDPQLLNPNSYNYRLADDILVDSGSSSDTVRNWSAEKICSDGYVLQAGRYYLGSTLEMIGSSSYVPSLIGRSSLGRLGLFLQISADLGNLGAVHRWTLELVAVQPLRIYAGMRIGQVSFWTAAGEPDAYDGYFGQFNEPWPTPIRDGARK